MGSKRIRGTGDCGETWQVGGLPACSSQLQSALSHSAYYHLKDIFRSQISLDPKRWAAKQRTPGHAKMYLGRVERMCEAPRIICPGIIRFVPFFLFFSILFDHGLPKSTTFILIQVPLFPEMVWMKPGIMNSFPQSCWTLGNLPCSG